MSDGPSDMARYGQNAKPYSAEELAEFRQEVMRYNQLSNNHSTYAKIVDSFLATIAERDRRIAALEADRDEAVGLMREALGFLYFTGDFVQGDWVHKAKGYLARHGGGKEKDVDSIQRTPE